MMSVNYLSVQALAKFLEGDKFNEALEINDGEIVGIVIEEKSEKKD